MKKLLALILAGIMLLSLAACGGSTEEPAEATKAESNLPGSWTSVRAYDTGLKEEWTNDLDALKLVFNEDGKGNLTYFSSETDFEWVEEDGKVVCKYLNQEFIDTYRLETLEATIEGDTLTGAHLYGIDFVLEKN